MRAKQKQCYIVGCRGVLQLGGPVLRYYPVVPPRWVLITFVLTNCCKTSPKINQIERIDNMSMNVRTYQSLCTTSDPFSTAPFIWMKIMLQSWMANWKFYEKTLLMWWKGWHQLNCHSAPAPPQVKMKLLFFVIWNIFLEPRYDIIKEES